MRIHDARLGRFLSTDPLQKQYPWYTPYQFAGNTPIQAIDLDGGEPKPVVKTYTVKSTMDYPAEKDDPDQSRRTAIVTWTYHEFTEAAIHLLSLVSGVSTDDLRKVNIKNASGSFTPGPFGNYRPEKGGGAMTLPGNDDKYDINYTDNFFTKTPKANYGSKDYSDDVMNWLDLSSHEVGHINDVKEISRNSFVYMAEFVKGYAKAGSHDGNWREMRADYGQDQFRSFTSFVDQYYGKGRLRSLFENKNNTDKDIVKVVDKWWVQYQKSKAAMAKPIIDKLKKNLDGFIKSVKSVAGSVNSSSK